MVEAISEAVSSEIETELINAGHTNVLLLRQVIFIFYIYTFTLFLLRQLKRKSAIWKKEKNKK